MIVKTTVYSTSGDLDIFDNKLIIEGKEIDLSNVKGIFLYLIYDFAEVEVTVFIGWVETEKINRLHINKVRKIELKEDVMTIYVDFRELFKEVDSGGD